MTTLRVINDHAIAEARRALGDIRVIPFAVGHGFRFRDRDLAAAAMILRVALFDAGLDADVSIMRGQVWTSVHGRAK